MLKRANIKDNQIYCTTLPSPVTDITLASDGENLLGLWLEGQKYHGKGIFDNMIPIKNPEDLPIFQQTKDWLDRYFRGDRPEIAELSLAPVGSDFRRLIWEYLCEIPYGEAATYGALAKRAATALGKTSMSAQAVGGAVGHNPISIIIPCHRVIGTNGSLTGYAGGLDKKIKLLTLEEFDMDSVFVPTQGTAL